MQLNYFTYKNDKFTCPKCGWQGIGKELQPEDFSEEYFIWDVACPQCGEHIGFWQAPLKTEVEDWKKNHPGWNDNE